MKRKMWGVSIGMFNLYLGYDVTCSLTSIQIGISKHEIGVRFDIIFIGIYIGLTR